MGSVKTALRTPWFWAIVGIAVLLLINSIKNPAYLALSVNPTTGLLTGNVLDILRVSAPIIMIALGMTFVIATGGIDLSVGSMMAVGGAVAMETLSDVDDADSVGAMFEAIGLALALAIVLGAVNGLLVAVVGLQPFISTLIMMLAARGIARVITDGQNTNATNEPFRQLVERSDSRSSDQLRDRGPDRRHHRALHAAHGARSDDRVDRHQPAREPARRHPSPSDPLRRLHPVRRPRGVGGSVQRLGGHDGRASPAPGTSWNSTRSSRSSSAERRSPAASSRSWARPSALS